MPLTLHFTLGGDSHPHHFLCYVVGEKRLITTLFWFSSIQGISRTISGNLGSVDILSF